MSDLLEKNLPFLRMLEQVNVKQRKALLMHASREQFKSIITLVHNILVGNIHLSKEDKTQLQRYRKCIRTLDSKTVGIRVKRELLIKHHSILPVCVVSLLSYFESKHDSTFSASEKRSVPETDEQSGSTEDNESGTEDSESETSGTECSESEYDTSSDKQ